MGKIGRWFLILGFSGPVVDEEELVNYIQEVTGIHRVIISSVIDAELMFLNSKGVAK